MNRTKLAAVGLRILFVAWFCSIAMAMVYVVEAQNHDPSVLPVECVYSEDGRYRGPIYGKTDRTMIGGRFGAANVTDSWKTPWNLYFGGRGTTVDLDSDFRGTVSGGRAEVGFRSVYPGNDESNQKSAYLRGSGYRMNTFGPVVPRDGVFKSGGRESAYLGVDYGVSEQYNMSGPFGDQTDNLELGFALGCELGFVNARPDGSFVSSGVCVQGRVDSYHSYGGNDELNDLELLLENFETATGIVFRAHIAHDIEPSDSHPGDSYIQSTDVDFRVLRTMDTDETIVDLGVWHDFDQNLTCVVKLSNDSLETGLVTDEPYEDPQLTFGLEWSH